MKSTPGKVRGSVMCASSRRTCEKISVLLIDSNPLECQLLTSALQRDPRFKVMPSPAEVGPVLETLAKAEVDVVALSIGDSLQPPAAFELLSQIRDLHPATRCLLLVDSSDREVVVAAFRSGVRGIFCRSEMPLKALRKSLDRIYRGQIWISTEQLEFVIQGLTQDSGRRIVDARGRDLLTPREEEVVRAVAVGWSNRQIALKLNLSEHTVKKYLLRVFDKLGVSNRVELVLYSIASAMQTRAPKPVQSTAGDRSERRIPELRGT